mgnify:CR=1 FL=1
MVKDTKNFKVSEFACKCCGANKIEQKLMDMCQVIRDKMGIPLYVSSGYRCVKHNGEVGGVKGSYHTKGLAADLSCSQKALNIFLAVHELYITGQLPELSYCTLYLSKNFVHIDYGNKRMSVFEVKL